MPLHCGMGSRRITDVALPERASSGMPLHCGSFTSNGSRRRICERASSGMPLHCGHLMPTHRSLSPRNGHPPGCPFIAAGQPCRPLVLSLRTGILRDAPSLRRLSLGLTHPIERRTGILRDAPSLRRQQLEGDCRLALERASSGMPLHCGWAMASGVWAWLGNGHPPGCPFIAAPRLLRRSRRLGGTGILRDAPSLRQRRFRPSHQRTTGTGILRDAPSLRHLFRGFSKCRRFRERASSGMPLHCGHHRIIHQSPWLVENGHPPGCPFIAACLPRPSGRVSRRENGHPPGCPFIAAGSPNRSTALPHENGHPPGCPFIAARSERAEPPGPKLRNGHPPGCPFIAARSERAEPPGPKLRNGHPPGCPFIAAATASLLTWVGVPGTGILRDAPSLRQCRPMSPPRCVMVERASSGMPLHCGPSRWAAR